MTAEDLGEGLLGEVESETLDKVGDDNLDSYNETAVLTPRHSSYRHCVTETIHNRRHSSEFRPSTSY